ncbi:MAG: hypothetical protein H6832_16795 [Planctomycetes bacterium]|nr:hypothetical protein [Planctomycetota bacterium]
MTTTGAIATLFVGVLAMASCDPPPSSTNASVGGDARVVRVLAGRLVDVYGLSSTSNATGWELYRRDMIVGPDIVDERPTGTEKSDAETKYDFVGVDPASLQPRLWIPRQVGSPEFFELAAALDDKAVVIEPRAFGDDTASAPYRPIPRNAAFRIDFSKDLGLSDTFFVAKDEEGRVRGIANPEAIQLLEIVGDPRDANPVGDFRLVPTRIACRGSSVVLDPVLLGGEARSHGLSPTARGMPASPTSNSPNIRIAIALEGPLRIPGIGATGESAGLVSTNLTGRSSVVRDLRSGNSEDQSFWVAGGYLRDDTPPRIAGAIPMRLVRVEMRGPKDQRLALFKAGVNHEIDAHDTLQLYDPANPGEPLAIGEIVEDPIDDEGRPSVQHVVVRVRDASAFVDHDPSRQDDFPTDPDALDAWLQANAPICVLATEFHGEKDDLLNFVAFSPRPRPDANATTVAANRNIAPDASIVLRFTKPIDMATVRPLDSLVFATHAEPRIVFDAKLGTPHLVYARIVDQDGSQTTLRSAPPMGFYLDDEMRRAQNVDRFPYWLHVLGGPSGIRDLGGKPLDFQFSDPERRSVAVPFYLDTGKNIDGSNRYPNNLAVTIARRFLARDEDEDRSGVEDAFGAIVYAGGRIQGRPTSRVSSFVDNFNQLPSPPAPPLSFCGPGEVAPLTAATPFSLPVQNPLNPDGARLQTSWREIDLSLSRTNPFDFDLDVERIWWAPFQSTSSAPKTEFDLFDRMTLYLGHGERRPSPCAGLGSSLAKYQYSGLRTEFFHNYLRDMKDDATTWNSKDQIRSRPAPHVAFKDKPLTISEQGTIFDPSQRVRYLPLPEFEAERFTWRDQRLLETGGGQGLPFVLGPFREGTQLGWNGSSEFPNEDGRIGALALPLLVDFFVYPDDPALPKDNPWRATGANGWQVSPTVLANLQINWRVYTAGGLLPPETVRINPDDAQIAQGGWNWQTKKATAPGDSICYWASMDFLKRRSVMTFGFVDLTDPHEAVKHAYDDPRLGPYVWGDTALPRFDPWFDPPLAAQPAGTRLVAEYRGADRFLATTADGHLDPRVAGNAHVKITASASIARGFRSWKHTERLTDYVTDPNDLLRTDYLTQFRATGPSGTTPIAMQPRDVRLVNWRFVFENNVKAIGSSAPGLDSFALTYVVQGGVR